MKIYTAFSESHKVFLPWFNTIKDVEPSATPVYMELSQTCPTGEFESEGWNKTSTEKLENILNIFDDPTNTDDFFLFSDVDVQFFKPVMELGPRVLADHDIVFQNDYIGAQCGGFYYCRKNNNTKRLFQRALETNHLFRDEQLSIQAALRYYPNVKHALLPKEFFTYGMYYKHWVEGESFLIPRKIITHHANWVSGIENKLKLLQVTRDNFNQEKFI